MLTAQEARKQSEENIKTHTTFELKEIEKGIRQEISKGHMQYAYEGYISEPTCEELQRCGFTVKIGSQYNAGYVIISW